MSGKTLSKMTWTGSEMHAFRILSWVSNNLWRGEYFPAKKSAQTYIKLHFADKEVIIRPHDTLVFDGTIFYVGN